MKITKAQAARIEKAIKAAGIDNCLEVLHSDYGGTACVWLDGKLEPWQLTKIREIIDHETRY